MRGVVMVLMAIDHVRVYSGQPAGGPTAGIFFTRWITHFVAPAFAFFAGTSAFLHGRKLGDARALSRYLLTRGLLLVLLELTVIRLSWTFNLDYAHYIIAGVIWMLGWCMVLMAGVVRWRIKTIAIFGLGVIFAQQLVALPARAMSDGVRASIGWIWQFLYFGGQVGPIGVLYVIVPWIGVMAAGYAFGSVLVREPEARDRFSLRVGLAATALFIVGGTVQLLLSQPGDNAPPAVFRLLSQQKYPASQLFLLMTLGPTLLLLPLAGRARGWLAEVMRTFGRVPLFYYLLHIPLIHLLALLVSRIRLGEVSPWLFTNQPLAPGEQPDGYMWGLGTLYLVWLIAVVLLYWPCRWYERAKRERRAAWMSYI
jgi:uncharacterized membrane protein